MRSNNKHNGGGGLAERAGFEPAKGFPLPDYESGVLNHSTTSGKMNFPQMAKLILIGTLLAVNPEYAKRKYLILIISVACQKHNLDSPSRLIQLRVFLAFQTL
jgi:hypothetical protein